MFSRSRRGCINKLFALNVSAKGDAAQTGRGTKPVRQIDTNVAMLAEGVHEVITIAYNT